MIPAVKNIANAKMIWMSLAKMIFAAIAMMIKNAMKKKLMSKIFAACQIFASLEIGP